MTPPDGFELLSRPSPLIDPWRPLFMCEALDRVIFGILVRKPYTNSRGAFRVSLERAAAA